jgi:hypothetical protein
MSYLRCKKIKGNTYYYLVKSQRVNGKVRQTVLEYFGAEKPAEARISCAKEKK